MARLSRLDVAAKAGVEATYVDRLMDLGLITPEGNAFSSGDVLRAGWIRESRTQRPLRRRHGCRGP